MPSRLRLRSSTSDQLIVPYVATVGKWAFPVSAANLWDSAHLTPEPSLSHNFPAASYDFSLPVLLCLIKLYYTQCGNCRGLGVRSPVHVYSLSLLSENPFWISLCKISNISTSDPLSSFRLIPHCYTPSLHSAVDLAVLCYLGHIKYLVDDDNDGLRLWNTEWCVKGVRLRRYVIQETAKNRITFYFRSPSEGNYHLTVYAQVTIIIVVTSR